MPTVLHHHPLMQPHDYVTLLGMVLATPLCFTSEGKEIDSATSILLHCWIPSDHRDTAVSLPVKLSKAVFTASTELCPFYTHTKFSQSMLTGNIFALFPSKS